MNWQAGFAPLTPQRKELQGPLPEVLKRWWKRHNDECPPCDVTAACQLPGIVLTEIEGEHCPACCWHATEADIQNDDNWIASFEVITGYES